MPTPTGTRSYIVPAFALDASSVSGYSQVQDVVFDPSVQGQAQNMAIAESDASAPVAAGVPATAADAFATFGVPDHFTFSAGWWGVGYWVWTQIDTHLGLFSERQRYGTSARPDNA